MRDSVFIWVPKTAGKSLSTALCRYKYTSPEAIGKFDAEGSVTFGHMDYAGLVRGGIVPESFDEKAFKWAFVRNPYTRAISLFEYMKAQNIISCGFTAFLRRLRDGIEPVGPYHIQGMSQCNPQVRWLENVKLDFIGRFEDLQAGFEEVKEHLSVPASLPAQNVNHYPAPECFWTEETLKLVEEIYREDFEAYGYEQMARPEPMTKERYWDLKADQQKDNVLKRQEITRRLLGLNLAKTDVLEVGTGLATTAAAVTIILLWGWKYKGIDVSQKTVNLVRDQFALDVQQGEIVKLPFDDASFDTILLFDVLEHVQPRDRIAGYHEISRVLKPFGKVVINMPLEDSTHHEDFDFGFDLGDVYAMLHHCNLELDTYETYSVKAWTGIVNHFAWVVGVR